MVARLQNPQCRVEVYNILIRCGVSKEYSCEVIPVQFALTRTGMLHTHAGTKHFEVGDVWFLTVPAFVWGLAGGKVYEPDVKINGV